MPGVRNFKASEYSEQIRANVCQRETGNSISLSKTRWAMYTPLLNMFISTVNHMLCSSEELTRIIVNCYAIWLLLAHCFVFKIRLVLGFNFADQPNFLHQWATIYSKHICCRDIVQYLYSNKQQTLTKKVSSSLNARCTGAKAFPEPWSYYVFVANTLYPLSRVCMCFTQSSWHQSALASYLQHRFCVPLWVE